MTAPRIWKRAAEWLVGKFILVPILVLMLFGVAGCTTVHPPQIGADHWPLIPRGLRPQVTSVTITWKLNHSAIVLQNTDGSWVQWSFGDKWYTTDATPPWVKPIWIGALFPIGL